MGITIGAILSATFYRIGGKGGFKNAKSIRRIGCPFVALMMYLLARGVSWSYFHLYILTFALSYGAFTTYHDYLADDGKSENWKCWLMTGACYSLATLPLLWCGVSAFWLLVRTAVLALSVMLLRENTGNDVLEEMGTGALYILTLPLIYN